jgi:hypothetical protein
MGMALAAITEDGDLLGLDEADIGITIIIDAHVLFPCGFGLILLGAWPSG